MRYLYFIQVFELLKPQPGEVFWDLGCGAAVPQAMASLNFPFLKACKGVEYLKNLANWATEMAKQLKAKCKAAGLPFSPIEVINGDILECDWTDADIIFFNSVCYPDSLIEGFLDRAIKLKAGTRIISLKPLPERPHI